MSSHEVVFTTCTVAPKGCKCRFLPLSSCMNDALRKLFGCSSVYDIDGISVRECLVLIYNIDGFCLSVAYII